MECFVCNGIAQGVSVLFSLLAYLVFMTIDLFVAFVDWVLLKINKKVR